MTRRTLILAQSAAAQCAWDWKPEVEQEAIGKLSDGRYAATWPVILNDRILTNGVDYTIRSGGIDPLWGTAPSDQVTTFRAVKVTVAITTTPPVQRRKP